MFRGEREKIINFSTSHHTPAEIQPFCLQELSNHNTFASHVFEKGQHQFVHAELAQNFTLQGASGIWYEIKIFGTPVCGAV